jgi:4-amino-4-deoxy-L-arabinose transferase-like glycosyltransferase
MWHHKNDMPQGRDAYYHLNRTSNLIRLLNHDYRHYFYKQGKSFLYNLIFIHNEHPPLYYYLGATFHKLFFAVLGVKSVYIASMLFFLITIVFCFKIGSSLFNQDIGILAACICSLTALNFTTSRQYNLEIATSALTLIVFYYFLRSNGFQDKKHVLIMAVFSGIAMLIKYTFLLFLFGYIIWFLYDSSLRKHPKEISKIRLNILLFSFVFILITSIYYANTSVLGSLFFRAFDPVLFWKQMPGRMYFYLHGLIFRELGIVLGIIFLCSFYTAFKKNNEKLKKIILFCIALPLIITIIIPKRIGEQLEFAMPILPFISIAISYTLLNMKRGNLRKFTINTLIIFLIIQCCTISFVNTGFLPNNFQFLLAKSLSPVKSSAYKDLFDDLKAKKMQSLSIGVLAEEGIIFPANFETYAHLSKTGWLVISSAIYPEEFKNKMAEFDYVIYCKNLNVDTRKNFEHFNIAKNNFILEKSYSFKSTGLYEFFEIVLLFRKQYDG